MLRIALAVLHTYCQRTRCSSRSRLAPLDYLPNWYFRLNLKNLKNVRKKVIINEISADELADMVADKLIVKMEKYIQDYLDHKQDYLLTRQKAADFLSIDISILYLWVKKAKSRVMELEIDAILKNKK